MRTAEELSLVGHLDTPILVGDPDGQIVYANPSFRGEFCGSSAGEPTGEPLAMIFSGGAREAVLGATAEVLQGGHASNFRIREGSKGWLGLCSPIEAADDRVGVVMVMLEEQSVEDPLPALVDEIGDPISEALRALYQLSELLEDGLLDDERQLMERGVRQVEIAQKWLTELSVTIRGGRPQQGRFDVASAVLRVSDRIANEVPESGDVELLMAPNLPRVVGTPVVFERLLSELVRLRLDESKTGEPITLLARAMGGDMPTGVLVSVVDCPDEARREPTGAPPQSLQQGIVEMGGEAICVEDSGLGRVTSLCLPVAAG